MKYTKLKRSLLFLFIFSIYWLPISFATVQKPKNNKTYKAQVYLEPKYRLGPGDTIKLKVFQLPEFSTVTKILPTDMQICPE